MLEAEIVKDLLDLKEGKAIFFIDIFLNNSKKIEDNSAFRLEFNTHLEEICNDEISNIFSVAKDFCTFFKKEIQLDAEIIKSPDIKIMELVVIYRENNFSVIDVAEYIENHIKFSKSIEAEKILNNFNKTIFKLSNNLNIAVTEYLNFNKTGNI